MSKTRLFGISTTIVFVGIVAAILWGLSGSFGWIGNETQEIALSLIMAVSAGLLIESLYNRLSPQSKMLDTTQTHMVNNPGSLAKLILPNNRDITIEGTDKIVGREDFLGVVTSDKLHFIGKDHSKIIRKDNSFYIPDLSTKKNGTTLNGIRLVDNDMYRLDDGDEIVVAKSLRIEYNILYN